MLDNTRRFTAFTGFYDLYQLPNIHIYLNTVTYVVGFLTKCLAAVSLAAAKGALSFP